MIAISDELRAHLAGTKLVVLPEDYYVISLPLDAKLIPREWYRPATTHFAMFLREPKQISLIVARRKWLRMQNLFNRYEISDPVRIVAFDKKISGKVCGYMAAVGSVLVEAGLCAVPISTFVRDHMIVEKKDLPRTVKVLREYIQKCKKG